MDKNWLSQKCFKKINFTLVKENMSAVFAGYDDTLEARLWTL